MVFDQWGAESHWDAMERLVLCDRGEGAERKRLKVILRSKTSVVSFLLQGVFHRTNMCCRHMCTIQFFPLSFFLPPSPWASVFESGCDL